MKRFQTVKQRARFKVNGYTPERMAIAGEFVAESIARRIEEGKDVYDNPAPPLSDGKKGRGYASYKARKKPPAIRNWKFTGRTLQALSVLRAGWNRVTIGFNTSRANRIAFFNNKKWRQFGVSPRNQQTIREVFRKLKFISVGRP